MLMGSFSDFLENEILDQIFGALAYSAPSALYFALSTANPTDTGGGLSEPSGGSYARVSLTNNKTLWVTASGGALDNAIAITFPQATASWGTVTHFAIMDATSAGNMIAWGTLSASKTIDNGDTAEFAIGDLDIGLD
jgi:hypothetical protein